ncbi:right-handed parallel beta-helix repeat-containing protein [Macrococcus armenti]|uniref:right-handed parallel beta-helix repeat-containing protein n=1 Tax=Macrococcus armenti TaxID=2875764 RepID=UPI001CCD9BAC|nr:hypothetical protein [Macrococcus armenti]UBH07731.1 hypothetical protein LAU41_06755 [Macrococcus armenti]UBH09966.1 hypothetical protein LAU38_06660 [Macrococcus armenti]
MNSILLILKNYIKTNDVIETRNILNNYLDLLHEEFRTGTLLHIAISSKSLNVASILIDEYQMSPLIIGKRWKHSILFDAVMTEDLETCQYVIDKGVILDEETFCLFINQKFNKKILDIVINRNDYKLMNYIKIAKLNNRTDLVNYLTDLIIKDEDVPQFLGEGDINWSTNTVQINSGNYILEKEVRSSLYLKCDNNVLLETKNNNGIFQIINGAKLTIENATIKSNHDFTFLVLDGELQLKNCEVICNGQAVHIENGIVSFENTKILQKQTSKHITSIINAEKSKLLFDNVVVDAQIPILYCKYNCNISISKGYFNGNNKQLIYGDNNIKLKIINSKFQDFYAITHLKDGVIVDIQDSEFTGIENVIRLENDGQINIRNCSFNNIYNCAHVAKNSAVYIEDSTFINANDQVVRIDKESEMIIKNTSFKNVAYHVLSGLDRSKIILENCLIENALGGIITQSGEIEVGSTKFVRISGEGAIRGINNDSIILKNVIIDSSLTDIIVDKPRKLTQENVKITNPVTVDDFM